MFVVYFDYMLSIVSLSLCLCISSYSAHPNDHRVGGRDHVSMVLRCYLPMNTLYISGHMVDHGCDTTIESFVVHSPNIGHRSRAQLQRMGKLCS
jgi:type 1 fimbria pilin